MKTFYKFLEHKLLLEQDAPAPDAGAAAPDMGGGAPAGGPPDMGGAGMPPMDMGGMGGGLGGPPMGGPSLSGGLGGPPVEGGQGGPTPKKLKAYNIWDVLEQLLDKPKDAIDKEEKKTNNNTF